MKELIVFCVHLSCWKQETIYFLLAGFQQIVGRLLTFIGISPCQLLRDFWLLNLPLGDPASWKWLYVLPGTSGKSVMISSSQVSSPLSLVGKSVLKVICFSISLE
jgi:hypothetical protein